MRKFIIPKCILLLTATVLVWRCASDSSMQPDDDNTIVELNVEWIQRLPEIDFVWGSTNPTREGWPQVGQQVTWRARVKNWSQHDAESVNYIWRFDGVQVASGSVNLPAGSHTTVDHQWNWTFDRHELEFLLDPDQNFNEGTTTNNRLHLYTDALTIGFYVEEGFYNFYKHRWVDWVQQEVGRWNTWLEEAIYPETPNGVLDRVRIDKMVIVPNGTIAADICPNNEDLTIDMQWGFSANSINLYDFITNAPLTLNSLLHELGHARYLIDVYGFDVFHGVNGDSIAIRENGDLIVGTELMPSPGSIIPNGKEGLRIYETPFTGLMSTISTADSGHMDRYSAAAMNLIAGQRATFGNCNLPENGGVFMNDLPSENRLSIRDESGQLLSRADIKIYQAQPNGLLYGKFYDNEPDLSFTTDSNGQVLVGRNPFSDGPIFHEGSEGSNTVAILRVEHNGAIGYTFLESAFFNLAYWLGETELADHKIPVTLIGNNE